MRSSTHAEGVDTASSTSSTGKATDPRIAHGQSQATSKQTTQSRSSTRSTQIGPSPMSRRPPALDSPTSENGHTSTGSLSRRTSLTRIYPGCTDQPRLQCQNRSRWALTYRYRMNSHAPKKHGDRSAVYIPSGPSAMPRHPAQTSHVHPTVLTRLRRSPELPRHALEATSQESQPNP